MLVISVNPYYIPLGKYMPTPWQSSILFPGVDGRILPLPRGKRKSLYGEIVVGGISYSFSFRSIG